MIRAVLLIFALGALLPAGAAAQDAQSSDAAKELESLQAEYNKLMQEFSTKYAAAETDEERNKLFAEIYPAGEYAPRFLELAEKYPGTEQALTALIQAMNNAQLGETRDKSISLILRDHIESPQLNSVVARWLYDPSMNEKIQQVLKASPHREVKAMAAYALAKQASAAAGDDEDKQQAATEALGAVIAEYGDVPFRGSKTLKQVVEGDLFESTRLQIGMEAPDIEGKDIDDVTFKLSDYRGQVVVLDFWGDW